MLARPLVLGALFRFVPLFVNSSLALLIDIDITDVHDVNPDAAAAKLVVIPIASSARPRSESFVVDFFNGAARHFVISRCVWPPWRVGDSRCCWR